MSLGKRRTKPIRAQLRPAHSLDIRQARSARQRDRLARLAVVALAVALTAALVHGAGPPFPYRLGQRPARELRCNVEEFRRINQGRTNTAKQLAAEGVPPILDNDPAPIEELARQVVDLVDAVAKAPRGAREALPQRLQATWKLDTATFEDIQDATSTPERLDALRRQIREAFAPLVRDGVLGPSTLPPNELNESVLKYSVRQAGADPGPTHLVAKDRVVPERIVKPDGAVAQEFAAAFPHELGRRLFDLIDEKLAATPTLTYAEQETFERRQAAYDSVPDVYDTYTQGATLVKQGQEITADHLSLLRLEHATALEHLDLGAITRRAGAVTVLVAALFALIGYYVHRHEPQVARSLRRLATLCGLIAAAMALVRLLALQPWDAELIPIALTAMVLAIAYNPHFALMVTFALCLMTTLALGGGIGQFLILMGGTAAGVLPLNDVRTRTKPIKVGACAALGYFVLTWAVGLFQDQPLPLIASDSAWRAGWGLMAGFFLGGILPLVEGAFGIVTGISLLELGDITHPLLQELVRRAPGTHNHSVTVGTIAEAAADRIGANGLLVRVGAYFHDIGKMLKPHYFVENQMGATNRHANLAPAMSTLIIIGHVKDGADLARQHHLPERIIDLIEQHHGTTLVEYFYREATRRSGSDPDAGAVPESLFRYPGPKPQTKEAGILMVADAVESASRTLSEPTPGRIEGLVGELVEKRLRDGQFDECGLTLREIAEIRDSLIKSLIGIYHGRVKYPEQKTA